MTLATDASPLAAYWHDPSLIQADPSAGLWERIAAARWLQLRQRQRRRRVAGLLGCGLAVVLIFFAGRWSSALQRGGDAVDWQARAQVLELQLAALDRGRNAVADEAMDVEAELGDIDRRLQTAYETKGLAADSQNADLSPLWKRRSELLTTLILARQQGLALTRI